MIYLYREEWYFYVFKRIHTFISEILDLVMTSESKNYLPFVWSVEYFRRPSSTYNHLPLHLTPGMLSLSFVYLKVLFIHTILWLVK